tara:strand:+ start:1596 stop:5987 length:4392 start_codon:yes stop_codon:yes gene_type:complete
MLEVNEFESIRIGLASPEQVRSWSFGEVSKPETINYRTLKPERDGLFCERIFGPTKDWECACGKYKRITYKGIICDKCGVEVTRARVRRERMGHVELATPVSHIWFVKGTPSRLGQLLDISPRNLEKIIYFASFIITELDEEARKKGIANLDEDTEQGIEETKIEFQHMLDGLDDDLKREIEEIQSKLKSQHLQLESEAQTKKEKLETEANTVRRVLSENKNQKASDDIRLSWVEDPLITQGEKIGLSHVRKVTPSLKDAHDGVDQQLSEDKAEAKGRIKAEVEDARARVVDQRERADETLEERIQGVRDFFQQRSDHLDSITSRQLISEIRFNEMRETVGDVFEAASGAEAVLKLIDQTDLESLSEELRSDLSSNSIQRRRKAVKRLRVVEAFRRSGNRPDWMITTVLPVLPPDLRPMVQLDGGRFATSDLNDLYRRVINRNNRLKRLIELGAPEIIVRNEKRMLQESVDALVDNGRRGRPVTGSNGHAYKSLSDLLRGKQGRFRQNLLGKRVDYSGRSVIVVGPGLKLDECGLPTRMALELFKPFVMRRLVDYGHASNIKSAKRVVERSDPEVWDILDEVTRDHPILLNRAPTLHRLGIQAFNIRLVQGSAIQIHPLVCFAYNADFDGDQMAVHVPLSLAAQEEARRLMMSSRNLLSPADGSPVIQPTKDMILGCYYLTADPEDVRERPRILNSIGEVTHAFDSGIIQLHEKILVRVVAGEMCVSDEQPEGSLVETTAGRVFFSEIVPPDIRPISVQMDKGGLRDLIARVYHEFDDETCAQVADDVMSMGFHWATRSGVTMAVGDLSVPNIKASILGETEARVEQIAQDHDKGKITEEQRYRGHVAEWAKAMQTVSEAVEDGLDRKGSVYLMGASGAAKGNFDQIRQIAGMRGLMSDPNGRVIEMPVRANFREGLSVFEYFISTHGARKGLADTALRTADSGYLTRRLVDVCQDTMIKGEDCGSTEGVLISSEDEEIYGESVGQRAFGRYLSKDVVASRTGEILLQSGEAVDAEAWAKIDANAVSELEVRSVMKCQSRRGVCQKCYGYDLSRNMPVAYGTAVGIIAAQSIGEPATQLTMRTFHTGGTYREEDITRGLPRVEELFEGRVPKGQAIVSGLDGTLEIVREEESARIEVTAEDTIQEIVPLPEGFEPTVKNDQKVKVRTIIAKNGDGKELRAPIEGKIRIAKTRITVLQEEPKVESYPLSHTATLLVKSGDKVQAGDQLTEGSLNPHDVLGIRGEAALQRYMLNEIQGVYRVVGVPVNDKHVEVVIRQMLRKIRIDDGGDTEFLPGELVDRMEFADTNDVVVEASGTEAQGVLSLLGVTKASLNTDSFLAAASFQDTTRVLTEASLNGAKDTLRGLKENVIIGKLIPAGTGFFERRLASGDLMGTDSDSSPEALVAEMSSVARAELEERIRLADMEKNGGAEDESSSNGDISASAKSSGSANDKDEDKGATSEAT